MRCVICGQYPINAKKFAPHLIHCPSCIWNKHGHIKCMTCIKQWHIAGFYSAKEFDMLCALDGKEYAAAVKKLVKRVAAATTEAFPEPVKEEKAEVEE